MIFHDWTVIDRPRGQKWLCRCSCGTERMVDQTTLKNGKSKSCGCFRDAQTRARLLKHGHASTPEYSAYHDMLRRCYDGRFKAFHNYGGRGIAVCDRWRYGEGGRSGLECFIADMGARPNKTLSLERIDNNKNYEPSNCEWADKKRQARNRNVCNLYTYRGKTATITEHAEDYGISFKTLEYRIQAGWTMDEAMTAPPLTRLKTLRARASHAGAHSSRR